MICFFSYAASHHSSVTIEDFSNCLAWFGPLRTGTDVINNLVNVLSKPYALPFNTNKQTLKTNHYPKHKISQLVPRRYQPRRSRTFAWQQKGGNLFNTLLCNYAWLLHPVSTTPKEEVSARSRDTSRRYNNRTQQRALCRPRRVHSCA